MSRATLSARWKLIHGIAILPLSLHPTYFSIAVVFLLCHTHPKKNLPIASSPQPNLFSQARDLDHLVRHGYTLDAVQPVDLFPQTRHIECVATISLRGAITNDVTVEGTGLSPY